jgi:hypothetical protein
MVELLLVMLVPTLVFGIFALLSVWLGAESRPWFDERPVLDDRPNWFPIVRRVPDDDEDDDDAPHDGTPAPVPSPAQPRQRRPAAATSAATSPSGV